jgi:hypothetical protein
VLRAFEHYVCGAWAVAVVRRRWTRCRIRSLVVEASSSCGLVCGRACVRAFQLRARLQPLPWCDAWRPSPRWLSSASSSSSSSSRLRDLTVFVHLPPYLDHPLKGSYLCGRAGMIALPSLVFFHGLPPVRTLGLLWFWLRLRHWGFVVAGLEVALQCVGVVVAVGRMFWHIILLVYYK